MESNFQLFLQMHILSNPTTLTMLSTTISNINIFLIISQTKNMTRQQHLGIF